MATGFIPFLIWVERQGLGVIIYVSHVSHTFIAFHCVGSPCTDNDDDILYWIQYATDRYQNRTKTLKYKWTLAYVLKRIDACIRKKIKHRPEKYELYLDKSVLKRFTILFWIEGKMQDLQRNRSRRHRLLLIPKIIV